MEMKSSCVESNSRQTFRSVLCMLENMGAKPCSGRHCPCMGIKGFMPIYTIMVTELIDVEYATLYDVIRKVNVRMSVMDTEE